jgi:hypothetical protein
MGLPTSRNTTYNTDSPVLPADLNALQDMVVGNKHPTRTIKCPIIGPTTPIPGTVDVAITGSWIVGIPGLFVGESITAVRVALRDSATGPTKLQVELLTASAGNVLGLAVPASAASAGTGAFQVLPLVVGAVLVVSGSVYYVGVIFNTGAAACHLYDVEVDAANL